MIKFVVTCLFKTNVLRILRLHSLDSMVRPQSAKMQLVIPSSLHSIPRCTYWCSGTPNIAVGAALQYQEDGITKVLGKQFACLGIKPTSKTPTAKGPT